jgi:hypothetical protein
MGGMMGIAGPGGAWVALWIVLGAAVLVTGGVLTRRALAARYAARRPPGRGSQAPSVLEAQAVLSLPVRRAEGPGPAPPSPLPRRPASAVE